MRARSRRLASIPAVRVLLSTHPNEERHMKQREENIRAVEEVLVGLQGGDLERVLGAMDDDVRWIGGAAKKPAHGKEAVEKLLKKQAKKLGGPTHLLGTTIHADGDFVFAEYTRSPKAKPDAKGAEHALTVFALAFGKIREVREFTQRT